MCGCGNNDFENNNLTTNTFGASYMPNGNGVSPTYVVNTNSLPTSAINPVQNNNNSQNNMNNALRSYIGRNVCCEFALVGNNLIKRSGILSEVGSNFIRLVSSSNCADTLLCNTSDLVFVRIN